MNKPAAQRRPKCGIWAAREVAKPFWHLSSRTREGPVQRSDIRAVSDLAGEATTVLTALVRDMHAGIAGRVFTSIGPSAAPTRTIHNGITQAVYTGIDRGLRGATRAAGLVAAEIWGSEVDEALESRTDSVSAVIAAVNGIYGDELTDKDNPLAGAMVVRGDGRSVALTTDALTA